MQKKLIALAVAAAFSAPAFADNANVTIYGKGFLTFDQASSNAAGAVSHMRVNTNASRFGVKGSEDLGDGLTGLFQYEVEMDADGSGLATTSTTTTTVNGATPAVAGTPVTATSTTKSTSGGFAKTRNSGVGIEGGFGKVMLGVWDSPFKVAHNKIELFDNTSSWTSTAVIGRSAGQDYNTRQKNMVQYWSPKMGGLQAAVMYSPDEAKTATVDKNILSMSATYDEGDIYASAAYERRSDVVAGTTDGAFRAVGRYSLGDLWVGAMFESIKVNSSLTKSTTGKNFEVAGQYKMGANSLAVSYAKAGSTAAVGAAANDVNQLSLKYGYNFSKRTELFAAYASNKANNGTSVTKSYLGGGIIHSF